MGAVIDQNRGGRNLENRPTSLRVDYIQYGILSPSRIIKKLSITVFGCSLKEIAKAHFKQLFHDHLPKFFQLAREVEKRVIPVFDRCGGFTVFEGR